MPPPDDPPLAEVAWRMRALETTVGKLDARTSESLAALSAQVASLSFVRVDLYESERAAMGREMAGLRRELDEVRTLVKMALGGIVTTLFGGVATVLIAIARGG